jgi:hypothetical protein
VRLTTPNARHRVVLNRAVSNERPYQIDVWQRPVNQTTLPLHHPAREKMSGLAPNDLTKLTVLQLKALCKDRHITGYSKLTKSALIHKLSEVGGLAPVHSIDEGNGPQKQVASEAPNSRDPSGILPVTEQTQVLPPTPHAPVPSLKNKPRAPKKTKRITESDGSPRTASRTELNRSSRSGKALDASPSLAIPNSGQAADVSSLQNLTPAVSLTNETAKTQAHPPLVVPSQVLKDDLPTSSQISSARAPIQPTSNIFKVPAIPNRILSAQRVDHLATKEKRPGSPFSMMIPSKKAKNVVASATQTSQRMDQVTSSRRPLVPVPLVTMRPAGPANEPPSMLTSPNRNDLSVRASVPPLKTSAVASKGTKFKPLVVNKPLSFSGLPKASNHGKTVFDPVQSVPNLGENTSLCYLDFPVSVPVSLSPITRPPSLSQRKRIPRWSIILSGVMEEDIHACLQVSRMFRYASEAVVTLRSFQSLTRHSLSLRSLSPTGTLSWSSSSIHELGIFTKHNEYVALPPSAQTGDVRKARSIR